MADLPTPFIAGNWPGWLYSAEPLEIDLLFRLISERYKRGSVILISNKYFNNWDELLSDNVLTIALLDHLLHHSHVVNIRGQTYRLRDRAKASIQPVLSANLSADD